MSTILAICRRELRAYFTTPLAYVFIVVFLALNGATTFYFGNLFSRGQADLQPMFAFHPWLYLILIPAVAMRLWAEERKAGTLELLMTLPVSTTQAVIGKFLSAWAFTAIALALTFPTWITVSYLGDPDHGVIVTSYLGSLLMAGAYLAIGGFVSALTRNQVIAFVLGAAAIFIFMMSGLELVLSIFQGWAPPFVVDLIQSLSFLAHYDSIVRGVVDLRDLVFFLSVMGVFLFANGVAVDLKRGS